jgi:hypothetical protein
MDVVDETEANDWPCGILLSDASDEVIQGIFGSNVFTEDPKIHQMRKCEEKNNFLG